MKNLKKCLCIITAFMILSSVNVFAAREETSVIPKNYKVIMAEESMLGICDGEFSVLSGSPKKLSETLMLPVRYLFESLGYTVSYENGEVKITGDNSISLKVDINTAKVNGEEVILSSDSVNINGVFYVSADICGQTEYKHYISKDGLFVLYSGEYDSQREKDLMKLQGVYMATNGKTSGDAFPKAPVNNFEAAKEEARKRVSVYGKEYPVYIFVKGGEYRFSDSVTFDKTTFGDEEIEGVSVIGYDGQPVFTGATSINPEMLTPITDAATLARLPKESRGKVAYMDLTKEGITGLSKNDVSFPYIYVNDVQQIQSRWPNNEFALVKSVPVYGEFCYEEVNPDRWTLANDIRINGFFDADYFYGTSKVLGIDADADRIKTAGPSFSIYRAGSRWYARNLLEEIDMPGEWFVDRETNILYFYPPYTLKNSKFEICTFHNKPMIQIPQTNNISFENIKFTKTGDVAINATLAKNVSVKNCEFTFIQGSYAIVADSSQDVYIDGNYVYNCAGGFIYARTGNVNTLESGNVNITNNRIIACGYDPSYINGVIYGGYNSPERNASVGTTIKNNIFQDCNTVYAVSMPGVDIKVLNNEIVNQSKNIHDGGAIYFGRAHSLRGLEVAYNYIHHLNRDNFFCGIYNDDGYSGADWHHNILYNMNRPCIVGLGMDMKYMYNLCIDNVQGGTVGSRMTWGELYATGGGLYKEAETALKANPAYADKFPEMAESLKREPYGAPWNSVVFGNVGIGSGSIAGTEGELAQYGAKTIERSGKEFNIEGLNSTLSGNPQYDYSDDYFVDSENQNWSINPESELAKEYPELLEIKMEEIGISAGYENLVNENEKSFKQRSPYNGQSSVQTKDLRFSWDPYPGATKYKLVVATDHNLQNVVFEKEFTENGDNNSYITSDLSLDTVYYWKVYAIGVSRQASFVKESIGAPYGFKTAKKNELNKENLKIAIDSFTLLYNEIKSGQYEYDEEFIKLADEITEHANRIYKSPESQEQIDALEEEIYSLVKRSPFYMMVEFKTPSFLSDAASEWKTYSGGSNSTTTYEGGVFSFKSDGVRDDATVATDTADSIVCFQLKLDSLGDGGEYQGFDYKMDSIGQSYLFIFKESIMEFQKEGKYLLELPNFGVKAGEWFDVELGAINAPGGVLQFARINGNVVFAALDQTPTQVREGGYFRIRKNSTGNIHMRPMENIPEKSSLIKDIYKSFANPANEIHLACLSKGVNELIEMDSAMFLALDKTKFSERVYPILKESGVTIEGTDFTEYKAFITQYAVLEAYNQGLDAHLFKNNVDLIYNDITQFEKIDENGVNLYSFAQEKLKDIDLNVINNKTLKGDCNTFDELRFRYAQNVFIRSMNVCGPTFAADTSYMYDILTKPNMDYLGIDIDDYLALDDAKKEEVHEIIGRNGVSQERTVDELVAEIHDTVNAVK